MSAAKPQAISGVSPEKENIAMIVYPSVAATGSGRALGLLYDCIPIKINGVKLSNLLFTLPTIPMALLLYFWQKVLGIRYILTNRSVQTWAALGSRMISQVSLSEIDQVIVTQQSGQEFYHAADIELRSAAGKSLMRLEGIPRAEVFQQTILKARDARRQVDASRDTIEARQTT